MLKWLPKLLKDRLAFTIGFFLNSAMLVIFYYLNGTNKEYLYPIIISLFIFVAIMVIEYLKYVPFHHQLEKSINNFQYELNPATEAQVHVEKTIQEIHQAYLRKVNDMNVKMTEKEHFFSHWIHHLKTPVSVIDLMIQQVESGQIDAQESMEQMKQENSRIHHILEQVLNVIRLEDFSKDYTPVSLNLVDTIRKVINNKKNEWIYNRVYPKLDIPNENIQVLSDEKWNLLMIEQIISNAIKYSKTDDESKYIYIKVISKENRTILSIRDEGIGIPSYDIHKIFEPFFTGENGRKYKNATGIGLYICQKIADKLEHDLSIESEIGKGTTITISYLTKM